MRKNIILSVCLAAALSLTTGCAVKSNSSVSTIAKKVNTNIDVMPILRHRVSVQKGSALHQLIKSLDFGDKIILVDKVKNDIVFERTIDSISISDLLEYIKVEHEVRYFIRKYGKNIYAWEEESLRRHPVLHRKNEVFSKIPKLPVTIVGGFSYDEIFNMLRENEINVYVETESSPFDYSKKIESFEGTLRDLLTYISSKEKLFMEHTPMGFKFTDVETRNYDLHLPQISVSDNGESTDGLTVVSAKIELLKDLETDLKAILSERAKVSINKSDGTVSIKAPYDDILSADKKIQSFIDRYSKTIELEMNVYEVDITNNVGFGIDYNRIVSEITHSATKMSLFHGSELFSRTDSPNTIQFVSKKGENKINDLLFNFLSKYGRVKVLTKPTLETINNLPVSLSLTNSTDYIKEISENTSVIGGGSGAPATSSSSNVQSDTFNGGFQLKVLPRIVNGKIKIALESTMSKLNGLDTVDLSSKDSDGNVLRKKLLQLKRSSKRSFSQIVSVHDGEMAIIGGYIDSKDNSVKNTLPGVGPDDSPYDFVTSSKRTEGSRKEIVITVKARVVD